MCAPGYHIEDKRCRINKSTCENGTPHPNTNAGYCIHDAGYCNDKLYEECDADGSGERWVRFGRHGEDCKSCDAGFRLKKIGNPIRTLFGEGDDFRSERVHQQMECVPSNTKPQAGQYIMHWGDRRHCELEAGVWDDDNGKCNIASDPTPKGTCAMALAMGLHESRFCHMNSADDLEKLYGGDEWNTSTFLLNTNRKTRKETCCETAPLQPSRRKFCNVSEKLVVDSNGDERCFPCSSSLPREEKHRYRTCLPRLPYTNWVGCAKIKGEPDRTDVTHDECRVSAEKEGASQFAMGSVNGNTGDCFHLDSEWTTGVEGCSAMGGTSSLLVGNSDVAAVYNTHIPGTYYNSSMEYPQYYTWNSKNCARVTEGTQTTDSQCNPCPTGEYSLPPVNDQDGDLVCRAHTQCGDNQYESDAPTDTTDRSCTNLTVCNDKEYEFKAPSRDENGMAKTDRQCARLTTCENWQTESSAPSTNNNMYTSDRICASKCGKQYDGSSRYEDGNCASCDSGTWAKDDSDNCKKHTVCGSTSRLQGASATKRGTCACNDGSWDKNGNCEPHTVCGNKVDGTQRETTVEGTPMYDKRCAACTANASAATDSDDCTCDAGYRVVNSACVPWGGECANGVTEPDQSLRTQQGQCSSCKNGYHLDNGLCKENRCVCDHGTPDSDCPENGQQKCGACDAGYYRKYTENVHRLPEGTNVNDLSTQCVARSRKNVNHGYELEAIRKQPVGCDPSYDEATVQYLMKTYNFDENDLRKSICLQTPENKKLVCDTGYFPNSSGDACVSCSPQENCNQNGSTCTNNIITCVTPKPGFYLDNGEVRACTVQANCNKHGDRCVGTKRTCTEAAAGYEIDESGLVKKQTCTDQANCEAHSSTECVIMDGERKNICVNANRGFYVSSGGKVQACTSQEHCISHFPVGDRDCVEKQSARALGPRTGTISRMT